MNRFFSKLDLRDIKIDPTGSSFPPDEEYRPEDEQEQEQGHEAVAASEAAVTAPEPNHEGNGAAWAAEPELSPYAATATATAVATEDRATEPLADEAPADAEQRNGEVLKVSARSRPSKVAGAIAGVVREMGRAEVQAIGAGATNQAVKAVAIARDYLHETGIDAICLPAFIDVTIDEEDRTAIRLVVEPR
jgi:stage V sporulation protein S